jgi:cytosine/adenosine deaminase-related metal-dependent hydrolase
LAIVDEAIAHPSGRLSGMVGPQQSDTCDEALFQEAAAAARARSIPLHTHAAFALVEFQEMTRRHGMTPIEWLDAIGVLGPETILAHCIFVDEYDWVFWPGRGDVERLARSRATAVHCPAIYARRGIVMRDFGSYRRRGVRLAIATDSFPHDMVDEMRWAAVLAKVMSGNIESTNLAEIFEAATVGGAEAVGRDDIGRLAIGAKGDVILVDLADPSLQPLYDPLRSLVFSGLNRPVTDSWVDGRRLMRDRTVLSIDLAAAIEGLNTGQRRMLDRLPEHDPRGREAAQMFPLSLSVV